MNRLNPRNQLSRSLALLPLLLVMLCGVIPVCAQQATVTFSGRVSDQNTGLAIAGAAIVAQGNQTGTRVAISDAQGNYNLPLGANTNINVRAYKTSVVLSPLSVSFTAVGGPPVSGSRTIDFTGFVLPFPILIFAQAPVLLTEDGSLNALTFDGLLQIRDPLPVANDNYFVADKRTRLKLFLIDLELFSGETLSIVSVVARDAQQTPYDLVVEDLRKVPGVSWLVQLTVILPNNLTGPKELTVTVTARGQTSNAGKVRIQ
jgi:hypothetical protein